MQLDPPFDPRAETRPPQSDEAARRSTDGRGRPLTPEQCEAIRQRVHCGTYDNAGVIDRVAQRILESGDLFR